jgi:hypothetical protein
MLFSISRGLCVYQLLVTQFLAVFVHADSGYSRHHGPLTALMADTAGGSCTSTVMLDIVVEG